MESMNFPSEMLGDIERIRVHSQGKFISGVVDSTPFFSGILNYLPLPPTEDFPFPTFLLNFGRKAILWTKAQPYNLREKF